VSKSALSAAYRSLYRKLDDLAATFGQSPDAEVNLSAAIVLAESLNARIAALQTGVALLRHEAWRAMEERKGAAA
jgi:hypothetical protein